MESSGIREKILHVLGVYPILSPTMLQIGLGTSLPTIEWRPVLEELIAAGLVERDEYSAQTSSGRNYSYTRIRLACDGIGSS